MGAYYEAEFGQSGARGYQLLDAARVSESIQQLLDEPPPNEAQARELAPLKDNKQAVVVAWRGAQEIAAEQDKDVTGAIVREAVARMVHEEIERESHDENPVCPTCYSRVPKSRLKNLTWSQRLRAYRYVSDRELVEVLRKRGHPEAESLEARVGEFGWAAADEDEERST